MRLAPALDGGGQQGMAESEGRRGERVNDVRVHIGIVTVPVAL